MRSRALAAFDFLWEKCMVIRYNADGEKQRKRDWLSDEGSSSPFFYNITFSAIMQEESNGTEPVVLGEYNEI